MLSFLLGVDNMTIRTNLILDMTLLSAFLVVTNPSLTGMTVHEWLALAFAAAIVIHLLFHWNWLVAVAEQFFKKLFHQSRLNYMVDALFFVAMTAAMLSGLMISKSVLPAIGIQLDVSHGWKMIHTLASDVSLIMLGLHFSLHFKWVVSHLKRYLISPVIRLFRRPRKEALAVQPVRINHNQ